MSKEGYLQLKIGQITDKLKDIEEKTEKINEKILFIKKIKEEAILSISEAEKLKREIKSVIPNIKDDLKQSIIRELSKNTIREIKKCFKLQENRMTEFNEYINEKLQTTQKEITKKVSNLQTNYFNTIIKIINEQTDLEIPKVKHSSIFYSEEEAKSWLKKESNNNEKIIPIVDKNRWIETLK